MRLWQSRSTASSYPQYGRKVEITVQALHVHGIGPGRLEPGTLLPKKRRAWDWWTTVRASPTYHQDDPSTQDMTEEAPYMTTIIRVRVKKPTGTGRRVGWNRVITGVDDTKRDGYAFEGSFLDEHQIDLQVGSVLVSRIPVGSARSGYHWRVGVVGTGGVEWEDKTWPHEDFLDFRDHVKELLRPEDEIEALREERKQLLRRVAEIDLLIERAECG